VTAQGSVYSQFKRALDRRDFLLAWTMAAELPNVPLADALSLLLLALDQQPWRFEAAAPRLHARLCAEARLTLPEAQLALAAVQALAGQGAVGGGQALAAVCSAHGLDDAVGVLKGWLGATTEATGSDTAASQSHSSARGGPTARGVGRGPLPRGGPNDGKPG
jgi:hypothetical protein